MDNTAVKIEPKEDVGPSEQEKPIEVISVKIPAGFGVKNKDCSAVVCDD